MTSLQLTPGAPGTGYQILVFLHVLCAVGGFGVLIYRSFVLDMARRRGDAAVAGALYAYGQVSTVAEALVYGAGVFGLAAAAVGTAGVSFSDVWVQAAIGVYLAMVAVLHAVVRPAERRYRASLIELAQTPPMAPPGRPPQLAEMDGLSRRIGIGTAVFNILLIGALYLMVFKP
ncbi:MAG TPA: DUF2269 family protein [Acidimicrobiales bacterium]|nr:DUF2269 family protein [Acidimicrobiales bacterium]